jgi:ATP-dependent DNA helicase RecQ
LGAEGIATFDLTLNWIESPPIISLSILKIRDNLLSLFKEYIIMCALSRGSHRNYDYFYFMPYYPKRYDVPPTEVGYRKLVWEFKDGNPDIALGVAQDVNRHITRILPRLESESWWLSIIPASEKVKTERRFRFFVDRTCRLTGLENGFSLIFRSQDTASIKGKNSEDRDVIGTLGFKDVRNKNILLFDDVITTGKSFYEVAKHLKSLGASKVVGLFLAKTEHWENDEEE